MNSSRIELALVLQELDLPFELDTFSKRLNLQKKIYLAQLTGVDLRYRFGWYIRGPYSSSLAADAFALIDEIQIGDREFEEHVLQAKAARRLRSALDLWNVPSNFSERENDWLELLASLHYLRHIAYRPRDAKRDFNDTFAQLVESKPRFGPMKDEAKMAWKRLEEVGLVDKKTLA